MFMTLSLSLLDREWHVYIYMYAYIRVYLSTLLHSYTLSH